MLAHIRDSKTDKDEVVYLENSDNLINEERSLNNSLLRMQSVLNDNSKDRMQGDLLKSFIQDYDKSKGCINRIYSIISEILFMPNVNKV